MTIELMDGLINMLELDYGHLHFWRMDKDHKQHHYMLTAQDIILTIKTLHKEKDENIRELKTALDMVIEERDELIKELDEKDTTIERLRRNNRTFANAFVKPADTSP